eukprot:NODE_15775_length_413_cov_53.513793_g15463_i0.p1 GENE.NODE_15775_length_413_cov_53.513793_g15463_i0~~NODE_15775_length_413_cov_53.513793_g15463_i0.p1  ORF type:complete len:136 (-),score=17.22 NODE_15775_length_413_cov_53.513793_g15463_i0:5-370(-)
MRTQYTGPCQACSEIKQSLGCPMAASGVQDCTGRVITLSVVEAENVVGHPKVASLGNQVKCLAKALRVVVIGLELATNHHNDSAAQRWLTVNGLGLVFYLLEGQAHNLFHDLLHTLPRTLR